MQQSKFKTYKASDFFFVRGTLLLSQALMVQLTVASVAPASMCLTESKSKRRRRNGM